MAFLLKSLAAFVAIILYFGWVAHSLWHSFFPTGPDLTFYQAMALVFVWTLFNIEKMGKPSKHRMTTIVQRLAAACPDSTRKTQCAAHHSWVCYCDAVKRLPCGNEECVHCAARLEILSLSNAIMGYEPG